MLIGLLDNYYGACDPLGDVVHPLPYYNYWIFYGFVVFMILHHLVAPWLFQRYVAAYKKLPWAKQMEWNSRFISTIHASVVSILCISVLATESQMWLHPFTYSSWQTIFTLIFSLSYFFCDLLSMPFYWRGKDLYIFTVHHSAAIMALYLIAKHQVCVFFGIYRLTTELSTPFTNQRWFYRVIGYKFDRRRVNSVTLLFAILFGITRNLMILPYWVISYRHYNTPAYLACSIIHPWLFVLFIAPGMVLDLLNIYWARKVYRIGWRSAKLLWQADWRSDLHLAKARLHHRLRHIHRRGRGPWAASGNGVTQASHADVVDQENSNIKSSTSEWPVSSSDSSSPTEYDSFDSESEEEEAQEEVEEKEQVEPTHQVTVDDCQGGVTMPQPDADETVVHHRQ